MSSRAFAGIALVAAALAVAPGSARASVLVDTLVPAGEQREIDAHGVCRIVANADAHAPAIVVPTATPEEWATGQWSFLNNLPAHVSVSDCATPMALVLDMSLAPSLSVDLSNYTQGSGLVFDWGDGTSGPTASHTYDAPGVYEVTISGDLQSYGNCANTASGAAAAPRVALVEVVSFAETLTSLDCGFKRVMTEFTISGAPPHTVTSMRETFRNALYFNDDIGDWDTSNVTTTAYMFSSAWAFDQDIGGWDVSSVTDMQWMFSRALAFNQDIGDWDTSNVTSMLALFADARSFNGDIGRWDTSNVGNMFAIFRGAWAFNQDIGNWDVSKVRSLQFAFMNARAFDQDIGRWDVSSVTNMGAAFKDAWAFNQDIGGWDMSSVEYMSELFENAQSFNQDINGWNVSNVNFMSSVFQGATAFNQDLDGWDVSNVLFFSYMFADAISFNGNIGNWRAENGSEMPYMFMGATAFNRDLSGWCVPHVWNTLGFDAFADGWTLPNSRPQWGSCPGA